MPVGSREAKMRTFDGVDHHEGVCTAQLGEHVVRLLWVLQREQSHQFCVRLGHACHPFTQLAWSACDRR